MNSVHEQVSNSDSEQCTGSRPSRVHSAPTLGLACAHTAPALRRVAGLAWSCRRPDLVVSQAWPGLVTAHAWPCRALCSAHRVAPPPHALPCVSQPHVPYRGASAGRVAPVSRYNPAVKPTSSHDTIYCITTHSPSSQALVPGKWVVAHPTARKIFFFICSTYWKTTKKIFLFFSFSSRTKSIPQNLFYFIFSALHTVKPQKHSFNTNFFFYVLFTKHTFHTTFTTITQSHKTKCIHCSNLVP